METPKPLLYTVTATMHEPDVVQRYLAWLMDGHVAAVLAGGAQSASIIEFLDDSDTMGETFLVQTQYVFPSRGHYDRYEKNSAALRAEGKRLFAEQGSVTFSRQWGHILRSYNKVSS